MAIPVLGATIDGVSVTSSLLSATWGMGLGSFIDDLSPGMATLTLKGTLTADPGDAVVITASGTTMWTGRLDAITDTRDVKGNHWTTVSCSDLIGALGTAQASGYTLTTASMESVAENICSNAGLTVDFVDSCSLGLVKIVSGLGDYSPYTGDVLAYINELAKASNAMLALQPDGKIKCYSRQGLVSGTVANGTFDVNTTGWAGINSGTISRVTASPHSGAGNLRVVTGTNSFGGCNYTPAAFTYRKGHTYRLTFWARTISGPATVSIGLGDTGASDTSSPTATLTASWVQSTVDWTPTADRTAFTIFAINPGSTTTRTFELDDVALSEVITAKNLGTTVAEWTTTYGVDSNVNTWFKSTGYFQNNVTDPAAYGWRVFDGSNFSVDATGGGVDGAVYPFYDWAQYVGGIRDVVTAGQLIITDSASTLLSLAPFDWVNDGTQDWQVLGIQWSAAPGEPFMATVTADDLIALL